MDTVEVQEFLRTTMSNNQDPLLLPETESTADNSCSLYYSISDDTLSNRLVDDLQQLEKTLTVIEEDGDSSQQKSEMNSVINNNLELTAKDEEFFQKNLKMKLFPNQRSQCSTPKIEAPLKVKTPKSQQQQLIRDPLGDEIALPDMKLDGRLITDLVMPLTTVLQKIEKKVTIAEKEEDKENIQRAAAPTRRGNMRKSLKPRDGMEQNTVIPAKKALRKSMIPNPPSMGTAIGKVTQPSLLTASRKSVRLSVMPTMMKSTRFTIGGASRVTKVHSPAAAAAAAKKSPKTKRSILPPKSSTRMTMNPTTIKETAEATATSSTVLPPTKVPKKPEIDPEQMKKRMSRIPQFPAKSTDNQPPSVISHPPRPDFACSVCKKSFHLKSTLLTHQKIHNAKGATASGHFKCAYCDKDFEKEVGLRNHVERYCEKVPVADKRKLNASHNRTNSVEIKDRSKKEKSSSRLESTSSSVGSSTSQGEASLQGPVKREVPKQQQVAVGQSHAHPLPPPASGLSPRKPIKSIYQPHSGIKFSANKPIKCYHCQITFNKYVDFHSHVEKMHPTVQSPKEETKIKEEEGGD